MSTEILNTIPDVQNQLTVVNPVLAPYVDDVFSTYLYTGNGSTQSINNGIDLAGKGGLVWVKSRQAVDHALFDHPSSVDGKFLCSNRTDVISGDITAVTSFNSNGFTLGAGASGWTNTSPQPYASWTFRKAPKFFDVVTYTGNGTANRNISHSLGIAPGMVMVKRTDTTGDWMVWHRNTGAANSAVASFLNTTAAGLTVSSYKPGTDQFSSTSIDVGMVVAASNNANLSGATYVAYLFAHDTSANGIIQCGSSTSLDIELGWEPQYILWKDATSSTGPWWIQDTMRGCSAKFGNLQGLWANWSNAESSYDGYGGIRSTGFSLAINHQSGSSKFIYMAIRRPNKPPTSGTQVYNAIARTGTGAAATVTGVGFAPDLVISQPRVMSYQRGLYDRLRGRGAKLDSSTSAIEETLAEVQGGVMTFDNNGYSLGQDSYRGSINLNGQTYINHIFRRAPRFFDVVCYTGTGTTNLVNHSLGVIPELVITKNRTGITNPWAVNTPIIGRSLELNTTGAGFAYALPATSSTVNVQSNAHNNPGELIVAYLFATLAGISKVGSYTGNGSSQTINCGFSTGARFLLVKRTDSTGDWFVWDTARGITASNDPHLSLNTTAAEVTGDDSIDPDSTGFIVNQLAATNINVSSATYIYLAIA